MSTVEPKLPLRPPSLHPSSSSTSWPVPEWFRRLTTRFPLIIYEPEDDLSWRSAVKPGSESTCTLW
ncbi:MAG: hypothetical protein TREMPRED_002864, partial [Tremellales sp. Tagirdzhanova-0007]